MTGIGTSTSSTSPTGYAPQGLGSDEGSAATEDLPHHCSDGQECQRSVVVSDPNGSSALDSWNLALSFFEGHNGPGQCGPGFGGGYPYGPNGVRHGNDHGQPGGSPAFTIAVTEDMCAEIAACSGRQSKKPPVYIWHAPIDDWARTAVDIGTATSSPVSASSRRRMMPTSGSKTVTSRSTSSWPQVATRCWASSPAVGSPRWQRVLAMKHLTPIRPSFAPILALLGAAGPLVSACERDDPACALSICDIEGEACHAEAFEVIACVREFHGEPPPVEVIGPSEYDERFVDIPQDEIAKLRAQQMTELRRALLLETMVPPQHPRPIAFYSLDTQQVIVVTTTDLDNETRVFVLMQAFASAQQAQEIDLRFLLEEQPTTDAAIAAAAVVHGEAHFSANLGMQLRRTGVELGVPGYYHELEKHARETASEPSFPHTFAVEDFIYGYGGRMAAVRWDTEGREGLSELLRTPPRSTYAIQEQTPGSVPTDPPGPSIELEPPYEVLTADTLGAWMFEIVLRRAEGSGIREGFIGDDPGDVEEWHGDEALFVGGETATDAALYWRLELGWFAQKAGDVLATAAAERRLPWALKVTEESLILVVTPDAAALPEWVARFGL